MHLTIINVSHPFIIMNFSVFIFSTTDNEIVNVRQGRNYSIRTKSAKTLYFCTLEEVKHGLINVFFKIRFFYNSEY